MIEVRGDLWTYPADVRVITTNGSVKINGECVMGRGCAFEAAQRWPRLPKMLGTVIKQRGNVVHYIAEFNIFTFPVKHRWHEKADLELIAQSAEKLNRVVLAGSTCVVPRPGCGNGHLRWEEVEPVLAPLLDDRFHIITF